MSKKKRNARDHGGVCRSGGGFVQAICPQFRHFHSQLYENISSSSKNINWGLLLGIEKMFHPAQVFPAPPHPKRVCVCVYLNYFSTLSSKFLPFLSHLYLISAEITSLEMAKWPPPRPAPTIPAPPIRKTPLHIRDREGWGTHDPTLPRPIAVPNYFDNFYKLI